MREERVHLLRNLEDDQSSKMTDARFGRELAREMELYEHFLEERNGIDFDDQKLRPLIRLQEEPLALEWLQGSSMMYRRRVPGYQPPRVMLIDLIAAAATC